MAQVAHQSEDITVLIEGDDSGVQTLPDGNIAVNQEDGGVVVQLNPQRANDNSADEDPKKFYADLCDRIDGGRLLALANELYEAVQADDASRAEWLANRASGMDLLGLKIVDPRSGDGASAVDGQSTVTNPLMLEAILKGWANAQAELLPAEGPCKVADYSDVPSQQKDELGEALQRDMNYYLTTVATEFGPETSHMLLWGCYFGGSGFKKVYTHPLKQRPVSEAVAPEHLIVSDATKDFASCERITHQISMRQSVMGRMQAKGLYRDIVLTPPTPTPNQVDEEIATTQGVGLRKDRPEDQPYTLWETQCELDLDDFAPAHFKGKGVPLPYLVTMDKDSREILAIRRDWKPEDEDCMRKQMYVKYPYVPGPGFYGTGLLSILGNSTAAMTAAWRISLDTGMYANFPAFLMDKLGGRQLTNQFSLAPGTGTPIETGGRSIKDVVMELPYKDVTPGMMTLIDKITEQSKAVGGAPDIPVGEGMQNIPVGTMLAHIEQSTKVMAAAHKGQHRAMDEELSLIADLFRENPEAFWKGNKKAKGYWNEQKLLQALEDRTLVPKSDPNIPSHIHRVMKAVALVELLGSPLGQLLDPHEVLRRVLMAMREDPTGLVKPPAPQAPSPEQITAEAKMLEAKNKTESIKVDVFEAQMRPAVETLKTEGKIKEKTIDLAKTLVQVEADKEKFQHEQQVDMATISRDANKDAIEATKVTTGALKTQADAKMNEASHALESHKTNADIDLRSQEHQLTAAQTQHQIEKERAELGVAIGQAAHSQNVDQQKLGIDGAKLGIEQQRADVDRHVALNPPKPAGTKKPKKKKK